MLDNTLGKEKQVNSICKSWYNQIRNIGLIHKYINNETRKTLVQALIIYQMGYSNSLLYNITISLINHLQQVQNYAASLVTHSCKREHITQGPTPLHWFPVRFRSLYKILSHTFKVLSGTTPLYLSYLI